MTGASRVLVALRVPVPAERAFAAFTEEIGEWWQPNGLFQFTPGRTGTLAFEPGPDGRLVETYPDGTSFVVGHIRAWEPPRRLVVGWRHAGFAPDQDTELHVRFDDVEDPGGTVDRTGVQTRVVVEHFGWDTIPPEHAARHGFPLAAFQLRFAEWWHALLADLARVARDDPGAPPASAGAT
ncbi:MAG: SRPBCC domain-containing protein [Acidimicrobiia bacterium]